MINKILSFIIYIAVLVLRVILPFLALGVVILTVLWIDTCVEDKQFSFPFHRESLIASAHIENTKGDSCLRNNNIVDALEFYKSSYDIYNTDSVAAKIITCQQRMGNIDEAIKWLDILEDRVGEGDFVDLRRCFILYQKGDIEQVIMILNDIIHTPVALKLPAFGRSIFDSWWHSDANYSLCKSYYTYYVEYYAKLLALDYMMSLAKDDKELFDLGSMLFKLAEDCEDDYAITNRYNDFLRGGCEYFIRERTIDNCARYTIGLTKFSPDYIVQFVSNIKWNIFNNLIIYKHQREGYEEALQYALDITNNNECNSDSYSNYSKYIFGVYCGASDSSYFPTSLSVSDLDSAVLCVDSVAYALPRAYLTIGSIPKMPLQFASFASKKTDNISGDKIIDPIVILGCNDWKWTNDSITFVTYVAQSSDSHKTIWYVNDDFEACESSTNAEQFGLKIEYIPCNKCVLNILQAEYDKQYEYK